MENLTDALSSFASKGSHRFNEIQQEDGLWEFVVVCGWKKFLQQNIRVIRGICGFKATPQISTNFHELLFVLTLTMGHPNQKLEGE